MHFNQLRGNVVAKRAFEICLLGNHRLLLIGATGTSKTTFTAVFSGLGANVHEMELCGCGNYSSMIRDCGCSKAMIRRYYRRLRREVRASGIIIHMAETPIREMQATAPSYDALDILMKRVDAARLIAEPSTDSMEESALRTMEMAARKLHFTNGDYDHVLAVSKTIARLDNSPNVLKGRHIAEAVQYRIVTPLTRMEQQLLVPEEVSK